MKRLRIGILLAILAVFLLTTTPVYADTPDPDSPPTVESINAWRNARETGDMLFLIYANIPYATLPDLPVTQTFIWRLFDTDDTTEFGSTIGYAYNDSGYGYNVCSLYFSASEVTALGLVWGTGYKVRLSGNPAAFDTPPVYNYSLGASDYSALIVTADVQAEIAARILVLATDLDNKWGLSTVYSLLTENETATVLSIYGEAFFRGAIYGLQAFAPSVFSVVIRMLDVEDRTWDPDYAGNLTAQYEATWVDTARAAGAALFGTDYDLLSIILLLMMCGGVLIGNIMLTGDHWNGMVDVALVGVVAARLGMYDLAFLILIAALCWIYISAKVWFGLIK